MKTCVQNLFLALACTGLLAMPAAAQTFTNLHNFTGGSDGANPQSELIVSGNKVYGTAQDGGTNGSGAVFVVNADGTGFTNLYTFTAQGSYPGINSDGADPIGGLVLLNNTLYGTTQGGGNQAMAR